MWPDSSSDGYICCLCQLEGLSSYQIVMNDMKVIKSKVASTKTFQYAELETNAAQEGELFKNDIGSVKSIEVNGTKEEL